MDLHREVGVFRKFHLSHKATLWMIVNVYFIAATLVNVRKQW